MGANAALRQARELASVPRRNVSRGALAGGFSKEALQEWASNFWKEDSVKFVDLYSQKVTPKCATWLNDHSGPSSQLTRAFFGSWVFLPERLLLTPFSYPHVTLPDGKIRNGQQFLLWKVVVDSPHEMILEWSVRGKALGCTMVAFDPSLRKVYHGNCLKFETGSTPNAIHAWYAQTLLGSMVQALETGCEASG